MIVVADFYRLGNEHVPVNACLLSIIASEYANEVIHFYAEEEHSISIRRFLASKKLTVANISFHTHKAGSSESGGIRMVFSRINAEFFLLCKLSRLVKKEDNSIAFFLSLSSVNAIVQKRFLFKKARSIVTLHGDVEFVRLNNGFTRNFLGRCFRVAFRVKKENCHYLVLDNIIKDNLVKSGFLQTEEIIAIPHPYIFKCTANSIEYKPPFKIGHIGVASMEKQTFFLFEIAEKFKNAISTGQIEFSLIGRNENIETKQLNEFVSGANNRQMLSREDFENGIAQIHYSIFFYNDKYQLTGSGAVLDAFNFEKPIIALNSELFVSLFARSGKIGFLCRSVQEMEAVLLNILSGKIEETEYSAMQENMRSFKKNNSLASIRKLLFDQLNTGSQQTTV